jgi:hypothetical protein
MAYGRYMAAVLVAGAVALGAAVEAHGLSITSLSIAKNLPGTNTSAGNFGDFTVISGATQDQEGKSSVSTPVSPGTPVTDTAGNSLTFSTRYAALLVADRSASSGTADTGTRTSDYRVQFTVNVGTGVTYSLQVDTKLFGALTIVHDNPGGATASISDVTGKLGGGTEETLGLATSASASNSSANTTNTNTEINKTNTYTSSFTGTQTFTLDFSWTLRALSQTDEAAIRLGIAGTLGGISADDYPGTLFPRTISLDGHFLTVLVTITRVPPPSVPMPASLLLVGLGAVGLGGMAWRRRRRER